MTIIRCDICDLIYASDLPADRHAHSRRHDEHINGVPWKETDRENIIEENSELRLVLIDITAPKFLRIRTTKLGRRANRETRYDFGVYFEDEPSIAAIIGIVEQRAVSILVTQSMDWIARWSWKKKDSREQPVKVSDAQPRGGCGFLWVLPKHRRTGMARKMADVAIALSPYVKADFPWQPPFSDSGERFLRGYYPDAFTLGR